MISTNNTKFIKDISFDNADDFLRAISYKGELYDVFGDNFIFRGHSTEKYKLLPTALRLYMYKEMYPNIDNDKLHTLCAISEYGQIEAEAQILFDFYKKCDDAHLYVPNERRLRESFLFPVDYRILLQQETWIADEYQELAALAQHYGLPTRLLDWTSNICVAIYFASSSAMKKMAEPEQLTRTEWMEKCRSDLDTVSECLKSRQKPHKKEGYIELWALDKNVQYADKKFAMPIRFVRPQYHNNPNLASQEGVLTYWQVMKPLTKENGQTIPKLSIMRNASALDELICEHLTKYNVEERPYIYRLTIPRDAATDLYKYAKRNHCDASYLFPGYSGVVRCMEEDRCLAKLESNKSSLM